MFLYLMLLFTLIMSNIINKYIVISNNRLINFMNKYNLCFEDQA